MKVLGVVPARYQSSRLPGKPIVDICGKPMIWWVYQQAKKVKEFDQVIVATDDVRTVSYTHLDVYKRQELSGRQILYSGVIKRSTQTDRCRLFHTRRMA